MNHFQAAQKIREAGGFVVILAGYWRLPGGGQEPMYNVLGENNEDLTYAAGVVLGWNFNINENGWQIIAPFWIDEGPLQFRLKSLVAVIY